MAETLMAADEAIKNAIQAIKRGEAKRVDIGLDVSVYKVPSQNPAKYTIRVDIRVKED